MEKRDARPFLQKTGTNEHGRNIIELESQRQLRLKVNKLIGMAASNSLTASETRQELNLALAHYGSYFATHLVRSLQRADHAERQAIVWLLTLLDEHTPVTTNTAIPQLQHIALNTHLPRSVRLSASLALAGLGATQEMNTATTRRKTPISAIN